MRQSAIGSSAVRRSVFNRLIGGSGTIRPHGLSYLLDLRFELPGGSHYEQANFVVCGYDHKRRWLGFL